MKYLICCLVVYLLLVSVVSSQERALRPINTASEQLGDTGRYFALLLAIEDYTDKDIPERSRDGHENLVDII